MLAIYLELSDKLSSLHALVLVAALAVELWTPMEIQRQTHTYKKELQFIRRRQAKDTYR